MKISKKILGVINYLLFFLFLIGYQSGNNLTYAYNIVNVFEKNIKKTQASVGNVFNDTIKSPRFRVFEIENETDVEQRIVYRLEQINFNILLIAYILAVNCIFFIGIFIFKR